MKNNKLLWLCLVAIIFLFSIGITLTNYFLFKHYSKPSGLNGDLEQIQIDLENNVSKEIIIAKLDKVNDKVAFINGVCFK